MDENRLSVPTALVYLSEVVQVLDVDEPRFAFKRSTWLLSALGRLVPRLDALGTEGVISSVPACSRGFAASSAMRVARSPCSAL